jgi:hypothetical protein
MSFISGEDEEIEAEEVATNEDGRDDGVVVESYNGVIMLEDEGEESEDHDDDDDDDDDEGKLVLLFKCFHSLFRFYVNGLYTK